MYGEHARPIYGEHAGPVYGEHAHTPMEAEMALDALRVGEAVPASVVGWDPASVRKLRFSLLNQVYHACMAR